MLTRARQALVPDAAKAINAAHRAAIDTAAKGMSAAIERAIEVGRLLSEEKAKRKHGEWIPWIEEHLECGRKQVAAYMRAHENRDALIKKISNVTTPVTFGLDGALKLLAKTKKQPPRNPNRAQQDEELRQIIDEQSDADDDASGVDEEVEPENYRSAFLLRASQAVQFATDCEKLSRNLRSDDLIAWARRAVDAWQKTVDEMENRK